MCCTGSKPPQQSSPEKSNLQNQLIAELSKHNQPRTALELARALGFPARKHVNPTLYDMKTQGLVSFDDGSGAPRWYLLSASRGGGESAQKSAVSAHVQSATEPSTSSVASLQQDISHSARLVVNPSSTISSQVGPSGSNPQQLAKRVLDHLSATESIHTTLELSKVVNMRRADIELVLKQLAADGFIKQAQSSPPSWRIATVQETSANKEGRNGFHENSDEDSMEVDQLPINSLNIDLSHIPEDSLSERLIAIVQGDPLAERTDLELARLAGSSYTRALVRPVLENLAGQGLVIKISGFPAKWKQAESIMPQDDSESHPQQVLFVVT